MRRRGEGWEARCPAHEDTKASLSVDVADDGKILLHCFAGCSAESVVEALGLTMADLFAAPRESKGRSSDRARGKGRRRSWPKAEAAADYAAERAGGTVETLHEYAGVDGVVRYATARIKLPDDKTFRPLHLLGGRWHVGDPDGPLPLFRLPNVKLADSILLCEGEKCVECVERLGIVATTSSHGANSASKTDWNPLNGKQVILCPDNDAAGHSYAAEVAKTLRSQDPDAEVRHLELPGLGPGEDIADWIPAQHAKGLEDEEIAERLAIMLENAPEWDCADCAESAEGGAQSGWPVPEQLVEEAPLPEFPIDTVFPTYLSRCRDFAVAVADCFQVPVDAVGLLMLPTMALGLSKRFEVEPMRGWREQLSLYVVVLMLSGERKSAVIRQLLEPVYAWQRDQASGMADEIVRFENEEKVAKERLQRARRKAARSDAGLDGMDDLVQELFEMEARKPRPPTLLFSEGTSEAVVRVLVENDERAMLAAAEGDAFDIMLGRYSGSPNFGVWLAGHTGDSVDSVRAGRQADRLAHPALQVALCVQPEAVRELISSRAAHGRGVLARFFFGVPESKVGFREMLTNAVPNHLSDYFGTRLQQHLSVPVPKEPTPIHLTPEAQESFLAYRLQNEIDLRPGGALSTMRSWGSKLPGGLARLAGIMRAFEPNSPLVIDLESLECALSLGPYLTAHCSHVLAFGGDDPALELALRIDSWIIRKRITTFSKRDAFNQVKGAARRVAEVEPALELLEDRHRIRSAPSEPRGGPGRPPSPVYLVNPRVHQLADPPAQNPHNPQNSCEGAEGGDL